MRIEATLTSHECQERSKELSGEEQHHNKTHRSDFTASLEPVAFLKSIQKRQRLREKTGQNKMDVG